MPTPERPDAKDLTLPEGVTANSVLNDISEKDKNEFVQKMAKDYGVTAQAIERFIQKKAREENDEARKAMVEGIVTRGSTKRESTTYDVQAREAVMEGIKAALSYVEEPDVTTTREDDYEKMAYRSLERMEKAQNDKERGEHRRWAIYSFGGMLEYRMRRQLNELVRQGQTFSEAKKVVVARFQEDAKKQNIPELAEAFAKEAQVLDANLDFEKSWAVLGALVKSHREGTLTDEDNSLLRSLVNFAKSVYFKGKLSEAALNKFRRQGLSRQAIERIAAAYKAKGPHRKEADKTSGASEFFGTSQLVKSPNLTPGNMGPSYRPGRKRLQPRTRDENGE